MQARTTGPRRATPAGFNQPGNSADQVPAGRAGDPAPRGVIKALFRLAAKAAAARDEDEPKSRQRRKRGETEGQFRQLVRRIIRRVHLRPQFIKAAAKAGRRSTMSSAAPDTIAVGSAASPWCNPLNGMDFYGSDLVGFSDSGAETDSGIDPISLDC
jgi:hypothetical protein